MNEDLRNQINEAFAVIQFDLDSSSLMQLDKAFGFIKENLPDLYKYNNMTFLQKAVSKRLSKIPCQFRKEL